MAIDRLENLIICLRNDTAARWSTLDASLTVLYKGEMGIEIDTGKFKFGDGIHTWNELEYASAKPAVINIVDPTVADVQHDIGTLFVNTTTQQIHILTQISDNKATWKRVATADELSVLGYGDMLQSKYASVANVTEGKDGYIDKALLADKSTESDTAEKAKTVMTDNGVVSANTKGANVLPVTGADGKLDVDVVPNISKEKVTGLGNVVNYDAGANAGNVPVLNDNAKLQIDIIPNMSKEKIIDLGTTADYDVGSDKGEIPVLGDGGKLDVDMIPDIAKEKVTGLGTASSKNVGTAVGNVVEVGADGTIDENLIPKIALVDVFEASSEEEMLAKTEARLGDICIRSDENKTYILSVSGDDAYATLENWKLIKTPTDVVTSVNGKIGIITLSTTDIGEGENLYYTDDRFDSRFKNSASTALSDSDNIVRYTDSLVLNCGSADRGQDVYTVSIQSEGSTIQVGVSELPYTLTASNTKPNDSVIWSISDNEYFDIGSTTGVVTFKVGVSVILEDVSVVVTAKSASNNYVKDTVTLQVLYNS